MTDIALVPNQGDLSFDIAMAGADLLADDGMRTAIAISWFADARAAADDVLPNENGDRRGWWGDTYAAVAGDQTGSTLWQLAREKLTASTLGRAQQAGQAALQWLIDDGVAASVVVTAQVVKVVDPTSSAVLGCLGLSATLQRPGGPARERYDFVWKAS